MIVTRTNKRTHSQHRKKENNKQQCENKKSSTKNQTTACVPSSGCHFGTQAKKPPKVGTRCAHHPPCRARFRLLNLHFLFSSPASAFSICISSSPRPLAPLKSAFPLLLARLRLLNLHFLLACLRLLNLHFLLARLRLLNLHFLFSSPASAS